MPYWMRKTLPYYAPDGGAGAAGADAGGDAAAAAAAAAAAGAAGADAGAGAAGAAAASADDWRSDLPAELKEHASRFTTKADLVKGHLELRKQVSSAIVIPGKEAKPEEIAAFREKLGVPKTPEDYKITLPDAYKDDDGAKAGVAEFVKEMHAEGVPPAGVQKAVEKFYAIEAAKEAARTAAETKAFADATTELKREYGSDYERNVKLSQRAVTKFAGGEAQAKELLERDLPGLGALGNYPPFIRLMANVGAQTSVEDKLESSGNTAEAATVDNRIRELIGLMHTDQTRYKSKATQDELRGLFARKSGIAPIVGGGGRTL